ncbi:glycosyltransferase family 2 protein [Allosphingosinicella deserti]|uniref:Glycosyl transferase n=1 Tax=Allosphingosinicella deserti TaxID=2116704 RepID=A0A2P7QJW3_9SPHN|nr:glycosyltransferase family A protein [Sphingomonas deserti]PSJ38285.1 glycosyl transferase [Sphingomonas deserti]
MKVTVGIKALNEEKRIADALESAVAAVAPFGGEVVLADSGSTDRTIEIAQRFPVRIVQLANPAERCCGAGAQLAFQSARGEYFYLLDGDMIIDPGFLPAGIAYLEANPDVAAVGGHVRERNTQGHEFQIRANTVANDRNWAPGIVDRLDCGGLYRTSAVREAGWFADRNLHAFEEFELASRLQARGWKLARIDVPAIDHFGHTEDGYHLLLRRIRSGYSGAPGEVLRGAIGRRHLPIVLRRLGHVRNGLAVMFWWLLLIVALATWHPMVLLALLLVPLLFLSWRRGSLRLGLYSLTAWNVSAAGLLAGFFRRRTPPDRPLGAIELKQA